MNPHVLRRDAAAVIAQLRQEVANQAFREAILVDGYWYGAHVGVRLRPRGLVMTAGWSSRQWIGSRYAGAISWLFVSIRDRLPTVVYTADKYALYGLMAEAIAAYQFRIGRRPEAVAPLLLAALDGAETYLDQCVDMRWEHGG